MQILCSAYFRRCFANISGLLVEGVIYADEVNILQRHRSARYGIYGPVYVEGVAFDVGIWLIVNISVEQGVKNPCRTNLVSIVGQAGAEECQRPLVFKPLREVFLSMEHISVDSTTVASVVAPWNIAHSSIGVCALVAVGNLSYTIDIGSQLPPVVMPL